MISSFEERIRQGDARTVQRQLTELGARRIPRRYRYPLANLCRRVGLFVQGLRLLSPCLQTADSSPQERAEYAVLLIRQGSLSEARELLEGIDSSMIPQVLLYQAFLHFRIWDYPNALQVTRRYLSNSLPEYASLVGRINLVEALVGSGFLEEAHKTLGELRADLQGTTSHRLIGNCLELSAQIEVGQGRYQEAIEHLDAAAQELSQMPIHDHFFVTKWKSIAEGLLYADPRRMEFSRKLAFKNHDWESVREFDRFSLKIQFDQKIFDRLVFGTPHESYRSRILTETGAKISSDEYLWRNSHGPRIDLVHPELSTDKGLKGWGKCLELVEILCRDFYSSVPLGTLFSELWPGENFDVVTSPTRLHNLIFRTRQHLLESAYPVEIQFEGGQYRLVLSGPVEVNVPYIRRALAGYQTQVEALLEHFPTERKIKAVEARQVLKIPRTTFQRVANWAIENNMMIREGQGPTTTYRLLKAA